MNIEAFREEYSIPLNNLSFSQVVQKYRRLEMYCERLFSELERKDDLINKVYKKTMNWLASPDSREINTNFGNDLLDILRER